MKLQIAQELALPLDVVTEKLAFLGRTGSGKSYAAMKLAELMLEAGAQIGVIDPVGVWRGLRVPATKGGQAFSVVVFGGLTPDIPIEPTEEAGAVIADFVSDRSLSFVLDVSQCIPSEQQRIVRGFAGRFFQRRKAHPAAVHLFMEECQEFIAENATGREEPLTLGVMQRLWKLGRNFGIGGSLITQRPQEVSKKALNMSGTLFAFQMTGPQERDAVKRWVADHEVAGDIVGVLQTLQRGCPHVELHLEPQDRRVIRHSGVVSILPRVTADLSSTPKVGASTAAARPLTPIDLKALNEQLQATIEKAKADDPRELRKQIAELKKQVEHFTHAQPVKTLKASPALSDADRALLIQVSARIEQMAGHIGEKSESLILDVKARLDQATTELHEELEAIHQRARLDFVKLLESKRFQSIVDKVAAAGAPVPAIERPTVTANTKQAVTQAAEKYRQVGHTPPRELTQLTHQAGASTNGVGRSGLRRMLIALAQRNGLTRRQLGVRAGVASAGGSFRTYLSEGRTHGWLVGSATIEITPAGLAALGAYDPLPTGRALLEYWMTELGESGSARMLAALAQVYPRALTRDELGQAASVETAGGSFRTYLSRLRTLELVEGSTELKASDELFE